MNFGGALLAAGLALGSYSLAQLPGTSLPPGIRAGAVNCTPNTVNGSFANVVGLWHFDNTGVDNGSGGARTLTLQGGAVYDTAQAKFGTHSLKIVTTGTSYAQIATGSVLAAANNDFTVEGWLYFPATFTYFGMMGDDQATWLGPFGNPNLSIQINSATVAATPTGSTAFPLNAWHHHAVVRSGGATGTIQFYVDGVQQAGGGGTNTNVVGNTSVGSKIGRAYSATYTMPAGSFVDEVRFSNVARYTATFTPPVLAFCNN